eukprot:scaffold36252_cov32-Phaeocystis_antarctica.AAC.1
MSCTCTCACTCLRPCCLCRQQAGSASGQPRPTGLVLGGTGLAGHRGLEGWGWPAIQGPSSPHAMLVPQVQPSTPPPCSQMGVTWVAVRGIHRSHA